MKLKMDIKLENIKIEKDESGPKQNSSNGNIKTLQVEHAWTIDNLSFYPNLTETGVAITSPNFFIGTDNNVKGKLILYPNGTNDFEDSKNASLFMYINSYDNEEIHALVKCNLTNTKDKNIGSCCVVNTFKNNQVYRFPNFISRKLLIDLLENDSCIVHIKFSILNWKADGLNQTLHNISENYEQFQDSLQGKAIDEFCDTVLICKGKEFNVHRNVLATRSLFFTSIFFRNTVEGQPNKIVVDDVEPKVMREVLRYIYTANVKNWQLVPGILEAANKFGLNGLKELCARILFKNINVDNVFDILLLADRFNVLCLKNQALDIITQFSDFLVETPGFESLKDCESPDLVAETLAVLTCQDEA